MIYLLIVCVSIVLQDDVETPDEWFLVEPPGIDVAVEMPTIPRFSEQNLKPVRDQPEITVRSRSSLIDEGRTNLTFVYHEEHQRPSNRQQINAVLDGAIIGAIARVNGELILQKEIFVDNNKGRDFIYKCEVTDAKLQTSHQMKIRSRVILIGRRLFSMNYITLEERYENKLAERFFDSFRVENKPDDLPPRPRPGRARELAEEK